MHVVLQCCGHKAFHAISFEWSSCCLSLLCDIFFSFTCILSCRVDAAMKQLYTDGRSCVFHMWGDLRFSVFLHYKCVEKKVIPSILYAPGDSQIWLALLCIRECYQARLISLKRSGLEDPSTYITPMASASFSFGPASLRGSISHYSPHTGKQRKLQQTS